MAKSMNLLTILILIKMLMASTTSATESTEYIKTCCNTTSYPTLCYTSLSKYSKTVQTNPLQLAQVATKSSLSTLKSAQNTTIVLYNKSLNATNKNTTKALKDCKSLLEDAVENTNYSLAELKKMNGTTGRQMLWTLSNVQTYMSAALTKEDTCTDGLMEMGAVVKQVSGKIVKAKQYTSNALGLVNRLRYYH